jgi:two-component system LytT family response regulator
MPGFDGFSVIQGLMDVTLLCSCSSRPIRSMRLRCPSGAAVDYLRKAGAGGSLATTMERVRQRLSERHAASQAERLKEVLAEHAPGGAEDSATIGPADLAPGPVREDDQHQGPGADLPGRLSTRSSGSTPAGDYMCIQTGDNTLILRETMKDLEAPLIPRRFQRVHRSTIVNLDLRPAGEAAHQRRMLSGAQLQARR